MGEIANISVHRSRRNARKLERELQEALDIARGFTAEGNYQEARELLDRYEVPGWAYGARVDRAGFFQHQVQVTSWRGH